MSMLRVFKSTMQSMTFIFKNGETAAFLQGRYCTSNERNIAELEAEIALRHPHIYMDANELEIDEALLDPVNAFKARIIAEYLEQQASRTDNDRGESEQQKINPQSSAGVAAAMAGGSNSQAISSPTLQMMKAGGGLGMLRAPTV